MRTYTRGFLSGLLSALLIGCTTAKQTVWVPNLSVPVEDPSKARVYLIEPSFIGLDVHMKVFDNDELIGRLWTNTYLVWERPPGDMFLTTKAEKPCSISLHCEAGQAYFIQIHPEMGALSVRCRLEQVDEQRGRELLRHCKPSKQAD
jgi:hypothetical protein